MAEAIVLGLAGKILEYIGALAVEEVVSWWGVNDDLTKLDESIRIIKAVLIDADHKQQVQGKTDALSKEWLRRLRRVLYKADDLFDEVFTVKQQISQSLKEGNRVNRVAKKVVSPFSKSGPIRFNVYVAGEIKSIRKELDAIKGDLDLSAFNLVMSGIGESMPLMTCSRNKWETASSVNPQNIVGRENDKNNIIEMLLSESNIAERSISVIPIVGFGGIGKTTLAQLVFNDDRVKNHFELAKWVWVPEKDSKEVTGKIFKIFTAFTERDCQGLSLERLQLAIRDSITDKRYLLVLDDVWDESRGNWLDLMNLLGFGKRGSKIIVTTRSLVVAKNVGTLPGPYMLKILSDEESWDLFQKLALKPVSNPNLIPIGREIVRKCANVPLAIKTIGCALYNEDKEIEWRQLRDVQLSNIDQTGSTDIIPALKLSYDQLPSQLQQCFAYCAMFKKNSMHVRNALVSQWIAQGFIKPANGNSSLELEDVGNQYFEELLSRNFFQDAIQYDAQDDARFRIHHLMHDLATHVAGDEYLLIDGNLMTDSDAKHLHDDLRHVCMFFDTSNSLEAPSSALNAKQMRSLFLFDAPWIQRWKDMLPNFIRLRSLVLWGIEIEKVPDSIQNMRHLRSLIICSCPIKCLPPSIGRLWNLQTLFLQNCSELEALPKGVSRLINLRVLTQVGCHLLTEFPAGFRKLKSLQSLSHFMVGKNNGLDALVDMNLRGFLEINYHRWREDTILEARKANLKEKHRLRKLVLRLGCLDTDSAQDDAVFLLEELKPTQSLKELAIVGYQGERLPNWMGIALHTWLPYLVGFTLASFKRCRSLSPGLSQLPFLKSLELSELTALEYVEMWEKGFQIYNYFLCLESLKLSKLPQLREWSIVAMEDHEIDAGGRHENEKEDNGSQRSMFPRLSTLEINECPQLISMPLLPRLQKLIGKDINESLFTGEEATTRWCSDDLIISDLSSVSLSINAPCLKSLDVGDCPQLMTIGVEHSSSIKYLRIKGCKRLRKIQGLNHLSSTLELLFVMDCDELDELPSDLCCLTALQSLQIWNLPKLTALPRFMGRLTNLHSLNIAYCPQLTSLPATIGNLTQLRWLGIANSPKMSSYMGSSSFDDLLGRFSLLELLQIIDLPDLMAFPESIRHLTHLGELRIVKCPQLKVLPDWFTNLIALQKLVIWECPHLTSRCKKPDGQDWLHIRHIPNVILEDSPKQNFNA